MARCLIITKLGTQDEQRTAWLPPCDGWIHNVRLIGHNNDGTAAQQARFRFGKSVSQESVINVGTNEYEMRQAGKELEINWMQDFNTVTNYRKAGWFVRRNDPVHLVGETEGDDTDILVYFDFTPKKGAPGETIIHIDSADYALDSQSNTFHYVVPFDMFLKNLKLTALVGNVEQMVELRVRYVRPRSQLVNTDQAITNVETGNMIGNIPMTSTSNIRAGNIICTLQYAQREFFSGESETGVFGSRETANIYLPKGSMIYLEGSTIVGTATEPDLTLELVWKAGRQPSPRQNVFYYTSSSIYNMEDET